MNTNNSVNNYYLDSSVVTDLIKLLGNSNKFILRSRQSKQGLPDLDGGNPQSTDVGSFVSQNDERIKRIHFREDFSQNQFFTTGAPASVTNLRRGRSRRRRPY